MEAPATPTKRCPGFEPTPPGDYAQPPHELPATSEYFVSNVANKDKLATRCKACGSAYGKAWAAAKKAGTPFSARRPKTERTGKAAPEPKPATLAVRGTTEPTRYHDDLALRAARGKAPGYTTETIGGVVYALPVNGTPTAADTPEGQAALEAINAATAVDRRARDAARKRDERAAARAKAAQQA